MDASLRWHDDDGEGFVKLGRLNHVGVATPSIAASLAYYRDVMGATVTHAPFDLPAQGVKVCFVDTPGENGTAGTQIELIEPLGETSPIHPFLAKNPAGGQHHMCYEVPDIHFAYEAFLAMGKKVLGEPRIGAHGTPIFFVHPKDMNGVLTEIMETPKAGGH
jgi:methylmalonyl-CoA/ethylmalonyl-CoA epimerase